MSAIKVARHHHSLALLGTNLSEAKVDEILTEGYRYVYLCLDNDATGEAIKLQLKWRNRLKGLYVLGLEKDIKNMNTEEFQNFLGRINPE